MQLEFFGETFDRSKCGETCDNCKAGREPERIDMTDVAKTILDLFADISQQRRGHGITMAQLGQLYFGSKAQSATKFLDTSRLRGYGLGSKFKKPEIDRIMHALVFDRVVQEISEENKGGFSSDYVHLAENGPAVQNGSRKFFVELPKKVEKEKKTSDKAAKKKKSKSTKMLKSSSVKNSAKISSTADVAPEIVVDGSDSSDDEVLYAGSWGRQKKAAPSVLPPDKTQELVNRFRSLVSNWADEEQSMGNNVFHWNIMSSDAMKALAAGAPTTLDELNELGILGENIIKTYGERIVKIVSHFIEQNALHAYVKDRRPSKRSKTAGSDSATKDDEFDTDIDFAMIPDVAAKSDPGSASRDNKSPYFGS
jgi:bloom syndrome protein